jgi:small-conductance mechanosensitive channel
MSPELVSFDQARLMGFGSQLAAALAVFVGFWVAAAILRGVILHVAARDLERGDVLRLLAGAARIAVLGFGAVSALGTLGVDVTALIAGLGLTGFALGFALKDALSSAIAGLMIMLSRPFRTGDRVLVAGFEGIVAAIDLRYVHLAGEGKRFLVPNATVMTSPVTVIAVPAAAVTPSV